MANLKNITEVPEVESLSGSEKVLLNVDGGARQVNVGLIKPKVTKELVYEWNFSLEDEVSEMFENINNDDLLWITHPEANEDFEIVVTTYASYYDNTNNTWVDSPDKFITSFINSHSYGIGWAENISTYSKPIAYGGFGINFFEPETDIDYEHSGDYQIASGCHADFDSENLVSVELGAFISVFSNSLKSVKIYKITK